MQIRNWKHGMCFFLCRCNRLSLLRQKVLFFLSKGVQGEVSKIGANASPAIRRQQGSALAIEIARALHWPLVISYAAWGKCVTKKLRIFYQINETPQRSPFLR